MNGFDIFLFYLESIPQILRDCVYEFMYSVCVDLCVSVAKIFEIGLRLSA